MKNLTLEELSVNHDYYASDSNYYSNDATTQWNTWSDFHREFHNADIDMNLVYRWDITKHDDGSFSMQITMIGQRKGRYLPHLISVVYEHDVTSIVKYLRPHFDKLVSLWAPLNKHEA